MFDWIWTNNSLVGTIYRVEGRLKGAESHCHGSRRTGAVDIHSAGSTGNFLTVPPSLDKTIFWLGADRLDTKQADYEIGCEPHIYKIDAVGYESLMIGLIQLRYGLPNEVCAPCQGKPKLTELQLACSRDGFHGEPKLPRDLFRLPNDRGSGNAHTSIMLGVCVITRDQLLLRSISGQRVQPKSVALLEWVYANGATGLPLLRCGGFASMNTENEEGILLTRLVTFNGGHIFEMSMRPEAACSVKSQPDGKPVSLQVLPDLLESLRLLGQQEP